VISFLQDFLPKRRMRVSPSPSSHEGDVTVRSFTYVISTVAVIYRQVLREDEPWLTSRNYPRIHLEDLRRPMKISVKVIVLRLRFEPATSQIKTWALQFVSTFPVTERVIQHMSTSSSVAVYILSRSMEWL
jgi:hypothetical protein